MDIHLPTLALAMKAVFGLLLVQYVLAGQRWLPHGAIRRWAQLGLVLMVATMATAWRNPELAWVTPWTTAMALGIGVMTLVLALLRFLRRRPHQARLKWALVLYCAAVTASSLWCAPPLRTALNSLAFAAYLLPLAISTQRYGWNAERALRAVVVALWVLEAVAIWRGVQALWQPALYGEPITGMVPAAVAVPHFIGLLALLATAYGYLLAAQERAQHRLARMATRDALTGLANRRDFEMRCGVALNQLGRSADPLGLALIDIDNFKRINDHHGHLAGDAALRHMARVLRPRLRRADSLARWGGEEFALLLPATAPDGVLQLVRTLRQALKDQPLRLDDGDPLVLTLSIGWISLPAGVPAPRVEHLMRSLDLAMYAVKQAGKDGEREAQLDLLPEGPAAVQAAA